MRKQCDSVKLDSPTFILPKQNNNTNAGYCFVEYVLNQRFNTKITKSPSGLSMLYIKTRLVFVTDWIHKVMSNLYLGVISEYITLALLKY